MAQKHEFASAGWFEFLREKIEALLRDAPDDARWNVCEVFTQVPTHLSQTPDRQASWHGRIRGRELEFGQGEIHDADFKVVADYQTVLPLARLVFADDPGAQARVDETLEKANREGKMRVEGSRDSRPDCLDGLHDAMARVTA